jgi:hypothetical protein
LAEARLRFKDLESAKGYFRHIIFGCRLGAGLVRPLDYWTVEENFKKMIKKKLNRRQLSLTLHNLTQYLLRIKKKEISKRTANRPIVHSYSDASQEESDIFIGGFLPPLENRPAKYFSFKVNRIPDWVNEYNIQLWEAIAAHLSIMVFNIDGALRIHHVDNSSDVYSIVKGCSGNWPTNMVVQAINQHTQSTDTEVYYAWISTIRNEIADSTTRMEKFTILHREFPDAVNLNLTDEDIPWDTYKQVLSDLKLAGHFYDLERQRRILAKRRKIN